LTWYDESRVDDSFRKDQMQKFSEENFVPKKHVYRFVRQPIARLGFVYSTGQLHVDSVSPSIAEIHTFISDLFIQAQLSAECSIGNKYSYFNRNTFFW
jgi:hypothetical protein